MFFFFFFSSRRRHTRCSRDWSSDVCSSDLTPHYVGTMQINVINPPPGGGTSPGASLAVVAPTPSITSISPTSAPAGSFGVTLTVNGSNFYSGSAIIFNGYYPSTSFINSNQLSAVLGGSL